MRLPTFDMGEAYWDEYKQFYIPHASKYDARRGPLIQFQTGELFVINRTWEPDERKLYANLNIQVVSTKDDDCPALFRPGDKKAIPKSHLNCAGQQILLVDWNHHVAVGLDGDKRKKFRYPKDLGMSQWLENKSFAAWYKGEKYEPIGQQVCIEYDYPFTKDQQEHLSDLKMACATWYAMNDDAKLPPSEERRMKYEVKPVEMLEALSWTFADMGEHRRRKLHTCGYDRGTAVEVLDYFQVRDNSKT